MYCVPLTMPKCDELTISNMEWLGVHVWRHNSTSPNMGNGDIFEIVSFAEMSDNTQGSPTRYEEGQKGDY